MPGPFDPDDFGKGIETLLERAADAFSKGREELLRQSRIGKMKLFDLTQFRRERARLALRLGEEAYRAIQAGKLSKDDLEKTYRRIVEMDEKIAATETEIEKIRRDESGTTTGTRSTAASSAREKPGAPKTPKKRPPMDPRPPTKADPDETE